MASATQDPKHYPQGSNRQHVVNEHQQQDGSVVNVDDLQDPTKSQQLNHLMQMLVNNKGQ